MKASEFYSLNENEKKIRKCWFILSVLLLVAHALIIGLHWFGSVQDPNSLHEAIIFIGSSILSSITIVLVYFFGYKRFGTKFLTTMFVLSGLFTLLGLNKTMIFLAQIVRALLGIQINSLPSSGMEESLNRGDALAGLIFIGMGIWWYILSWKLRKINVTIKRVKKLSKPTEELDRILDQIRKAQTLKDLDTYLHDSVVKWPQFEPMLSREYHMKKENLSPSS